MLRFARNDSFSNSDLFQDCSNPIEFEVIARIRQLAETKQSSTIGSDIINRALSNCQLIRLGRHFV